MVRISTKLYSLEHQVFYSTNCIVSFDKKFIAMNTFFVCLFVCLFVGLFVCLFVCVLWGGSVYSISLQELVGTHTTNIRLLKHFNILHLEMSQESI